jgi:hypothetical protein
MANARIGRRGKIIELLPRVDYEAIVRATTSRRADMGTRVELVCQHGGPANGVDPTRIPVW